VDYNEQIKCTPATIGHNITLLAAHKEQDAIYAETPFRISNCKNSGFKWYISRIVNSQEEETSMKRKQLISILTCMSMLTSSFLSLTAVATEAMTEDAPSDWGEYEITDDGFGNLTANFPDEYPMDMIKSEDEETVSAKVEALLKTLTLEEKIDLVSADGAVGTQTYNSDRPYRTGYWKGCARVGIPVMAFYDGPMGIRMNAGYETTRPASENSVAAMFDQNAAYDYGTIYGTENKNTSSNNQLGAQVDLLYDLTRSRGKDMFGEDWYLASTTAASAVKAMQDNNVSATLKHYLNDGDVDEQTLHETYLEVFKKSIKEGNATSLMTGYELTNGVAACEDDYLNKTVLRDMWKYDGLVMTDWGGNYSFTLDDGVTMETPSNTYNNEENIKAALETGEITEDDLDQAVRYDLTAMGKMGYLGMVAISKDGTAAVDYDAPDVIEIPDVVKGEERTAMLEENNQKAIETAEKGAVLVKNENDTLPLNDGGSVALIGLGSTYTVAGSHGENAFGYLKQLAISPYDALKEQMPDSDVQSYVAQDIVGEAIPAGYLYVDADATKNGVTRTGHDGDGNEVNTVDADVNFVTNSTDYFNAEDGTAFPYGKMGAAYTMTTYVKAPSTGKYEIKVEGIYANTISAEIEVDGETYTMAAAAGDAGTGFVATSGLVTTDSGLDIPSEELENPFAAWFGGAAEESTEETAGEPAEAEATEAAAEETAATEAVEEETEDAATMNFQSMMASWEPTYANFDLEEGKTYKITITFDAGLDEDRQYLAGTKDTQIRLAWITPEQKENNYTSAVEAAKTADTSVVFMTSLQDLSFDDEQLTLLNNVIENAKANGHKVAVVITDGLLPDISSFVDNVDAVLMVWQPGQGGGTVIGNILSGACNPSGKLPVTWPSDYSDTNAQMHEEGRSAEANGPSSGTSIALKEGVFVGYKWYDAAGKQDSVLYDFGYGLSYTNFDYEVENVTEKAEGVDDIGYDVTVKVTNTGDVAGSAVPQIYLKAADLENGVYTPQDVQKNWHYTDNDGDGAEDYLPEVDGVQQAQYQLIGYAHTDEIQPGESAEVTIHLDQRSFSYWDTSIPDDKLYERKDGSKDKYTVITGERTLYLAQSSDNLGAEFTVDVEE